MANLPKPIKTLWCVYDACGQEFTTADPHYYREETDVCYCSEGCFEAEAESRCDSSSRSYSKQQVELMADDELLRAFTQVTGKTSLPCKHCHYKFVELERFVLSIRKRCCKPSTNGLHSKITVPKTCDHQIINNMKRGGLYRAIKKTCVEEEIETIKSQLKETLTERRTGIRRV